VSSIIVDESLSQRGRCDSSQNPRERLFKLQRGVTEAAWANEYQRQALSQIEEQFFG
jgi:hypothetical protein